MSSLDANAKAMLEEMKDGNPVDVKCLSVDNNKYVIEDRKHRSSSLFTYRFEQPLQANFCYRVRLDENNKFEVIKELGVKP